MTLSISFEFIIMAVAQSETSSQMQALQELEKNGLTVGWATPRVGNPIPKVASGKLNEIIAAISEAGYRVEKKDLIIFVSPANQDSSLGTKISEVTFNGVSATDAIEKLRQISGAQLFLLEMPQALKGSRVTLSLKDVSVYEILTRMAYAIGAKSWTTAQIETKNGPISNGPTYILDFRL